MEKTLDVDNVNTEYADLSQPSIGQRGKINKTPLYSPENLKFRQNGFWKITSVLIHKNFKVLIQKPIFLQSQVLTLVLVCSVIYGLNSLTRWSYRTAPSMIYPVEDVTEI
jgi:hypothetical protein